MKVPTKRILLPDMIFLEYHSDRKAGELSGHA